MKCFFSFFIQQIFVSFNHSNMIVVRMEMDVPCRVQSERVKIISFSLLHHCEAKYMISP